MNGRQLVEWVLHEAAIPSVDEVCKMVGRSRGECWGCPITSCPRQITPFEISYEDNLVIEKALAKLKSNQIWIGSISGRRIYETMLKYADGDVSELARHIFYLLTLHRERFLLNQAVESAAIGNQTIEKAAASVRYLGKDTKQHKNIHTFRRLVDVRSNRTGT